MSVKIKVQPVSDQSVGIAHTLDGPLDRAGGYWTHDTFTERLLQGQVIRRADPEVAPVPAKPAARERSAA